MESAPRMSGRWVGDGTAPIARASEPVELSVPGRVALRRSEEVPTLEEAVTRICSLLREGRKRPLFVEWLLRGRTTHLLHQNSDDLVGVSSLVVVQHIPR